MRGAQERSPPGRAEEFDNLSFFWGYLKKTTCKSCGKMGKLSKTMSFSERKMTSGKASLKKGLE